MGEDVHDSRSEMSSDTRDTNYVPVTEHFVLANCQITPSYNENGGFCKKL